METVKFETEDSIAVVTINRPAVRNTVDRATAYDQASIAITTNTATASRRFDRARRSRGARRFAAGQGRHGKFQPGSHNYRIGPVTVVEFNNPP